jgi:hypothetical protein
MQLRPIKGYEPVHPFPPHPTDDETEIAGQRHEIGAGALDRCAALSARGRMASRWEIEPEFDVGELRRCAYWIQQRIGSPHREARVAQVVGRLQPGERVGPVAPLRVYLGIIIRPVIAHRCAELGQTGLRFRQPAELVHGDSQAQSLPGVAVRRATLARRLRLLLGKVDQRRCQLIARGLERSEGVGVPQRSQGVVVASVLAENFRLIGERAARARTDGPSIVCQRFP